MTGSDVVEITRTSLITCWEIHFSTDTLPLLYRMQLLWGAIVCRMRSPVAGPLMGIERIADRIDESGGVSRDVDVVSFHVLVIAVNNMSLRWLGKASDNNIEQMHF